MVCKAMSKFESVSGANMNEKCHEELSALMDGELSELELRRLLKHGVDDPRLLEKWQRMHWVRSVMRGEQREPGMRAINLDLTQRVAAALEQEETHQNSPVPGHKAAPVAGWREAVARPFASVAIAASVSAMVVVGWQSLNQAPSVNPAANAVLVQAQAAGNPATAFIQGASGAMPVAQSYYSTQRLASQQGAAQQLEVIRISDQQYDERLRRYLISHSGNAAQHTASGTYSYARAVSLKPANAKQ